LGPLWTANQETMICVMSAYMEYLLHPNSAKASGVRMNNSYKIVLIQTRLLKVHTCMHARARTHTHTLHYILWILS
jgi:hypothetical protein